MDINKFKYDFYRFACAVTFGKTKRFYYNKKCKYKNIREENYDLIYSYDYNRSKGIQVRRNEFFDEQLTRLVSYQTLNKIRELELKRKIKEGHKVRVLFLVDEISRIQFDSVYQNMLNSELFEPFLVKYPPNDDMFKTDLSHYNRHLEDLRILKDKNYIVYDGYDENKNFIPIQLFKPDIVFTNAPYLDVSNTLLKNMYLNTNFLVCHINYFFTTVNAYDYHYNNHRISSAWLHFVSTREDYEEMLKYSQLFGLNAILSGYPKMDFYTSDIKNCKIPSKIDNGKPIVIYAPHWTIQLTKDKEMLSLSTFHLYHRTFLDMVKNNPDINFVFKPHPLLGDRLQMTNIMNSNEYKQYIDEWNSQPNGIYVFDGHYIDLFRRSNLLITDCGSFIGEWLPTDMPCMYLVSPERNQETYMDSFSLLGRKILDKYYLCHNQKEIKDKFKMLIIDKNDPLKEERIKIKNEIFINFGSAGQKIVEYLTDILSN